MTQAVENLPAVQETTCSAGDLGSIPGSGGSPEKGMVTHSSNLPGESHRQRSLVGYSPLGCKSWILTEQ